MAGQRPGFARVVFDEIAWQEDLLSVTSAGQEIAERTRARLDRDGQAVDALLPCQAEGPDGTSLQGCVKVYVPPPSGHWGLVYLIVRDKSGSLHLDHLAFGLRHPPRGRRLSVYRIAHRRLHG